MARSIIARLYTIGERLPPWLRPAFFGAVLLFAIVGLRTLFALPLILRQPEKLSEFALGLLGAAGAGAIGGFGYTFVGAPARRIPLIGPYVAGVVTIAAYMLGALVLFTFIIPDDPLISDRTGLISFGVVTVFFGLMAGYFWFRDEPFPNPVRPRGDRIARFGLLALVALLFGGIAYATNPDQPWRALIGGAVSFLIAWHLLRREDAQQAAFDPQLDIAIKRAAKLEKQDPAAAQRLLDDYMTARMEREGKELAALRLAAPRDLAAAIALRGRLVGEIEENALVRADLPHSALPEIDRQAMRAQIDQVDSAHQAEIRNLDGTIEHLKRERAV